MIGGDKGSLAGLSWIPAPPWPGRAAWPDTGLAPFPDAAAPPISGLVFLVLIGDERLDDRPAWRRGRAVLRAVSSEIAGTQEVAYQVRAVASSHGAGPSRLRRAGRLPRRHLRRAAGGLDFARALGTIRVTLRRDQTALELSGLPAARPSIVFFAVDPPLADAVSAEEYAGLAGEAAITWVVPEGKAPLLSPVLAAGDARVLTDHDRVADEVARHLRRSRA